MRGRSIAILLAATRLAVAQPDPEAARIFQRGRELAKLGQLTEACALFARSYELDPALGTAVNLADCLERQGQLRRAWVLFDVVARNSQSVQSRARLARQRADALVAKLATVVVTLHDPHAAGLAIRLGDRELTPAAEIRDLIEPRDVDLVATAPGRPAFKTTLHAMAGQTVTADIPAFAALPDESTATRRRRSRVVLASGLGGVGAIGLGISLGLGISARRTYASAFDRGCLHDLGRVACTDAGKAIVDRAGRRADLATGFAIAGAVVAAAGAAVFVTAPREAVQLAPVATGHELGVVVVGRF